MNTPSLPLPKLSWPGARLYSTVVAVVLSVQCIKALVHAFERYSVLALDGTASLHAVGAVAEGYLWAALLFWAAALGFIAARKG